MFLFESRWMDHLPSLPKFIQVVSQILEQTVENALAHRHLPTETKIARGHHKHQPLYDFECQNLRFIRGDQNLRFIRGDKNEDPGYFLPVGQVQAMNLAFAMLGHPRLGCAAAGSIVGNDSIKLVLAQFSEPLN